LGQPRGGLLAANLALFFIGSTLVGANAVLVGVVTLLRSDLSRIETEKESRLVPVVIMTRDLGPGTIISPGDFEIRQIDKAFVPFEACRDPKEVLGRTVRDDVREGDIARVERLSAPGAGYGLDALISQGMRAISLELRDGDRVSGFAEPGDHVDLLVTLPDDHGVPAETISVLQGMRLLAVDEKISETAKGEVVRTPLVTILVPSDSAESVIHSVQIGQPKLVLRAEVDFGMPNLRDAAPPWLGSHRTTLAANEFRARYDEDDVQEWMEIIAGRNVIREPVIDPTMLRDIPTLP
jgi:pilus assembly protein CpaB